MRLIAVELRNFKSFGSDPARVPFEPGMNVLSGPNGAGKSSVLEAVGLVLFQRTPPNVSQKDFARRGGGSWSVTVTFEGVDKLRYRVERSERRCVLFEEGREEELASGVQLVAERLQDLTGVDPDMPPPEFFKRVLCSPQGEYTRDLEQTASERRKLFDPLFKVDRFKALDANLAPIASRNSLVIERTKELENEAGILRERAAELGETRKRKDQVSREMRQRTKEAEEAATRLAEVRSKLETLGEKRRKLDDLRREVELRSERMRNHQEKLEAARSRVEEAEKAAARREEHRAGKEEHDRARKALEELAPKKKEAHSAKEELARLSEQRQQNTRALERSTEERDRREATVAEETDRLAARQDELRKVREEHEEVAARAAGHRADLETLRAAAREAESHVDRARHTLRDLLREESELEERAKRLADLQAAARRAEDRREEQGRLPQLEEGLRKLREEHAAACAQIEGIERDRKILELGQCPFVQVECPGIEGRSISDEVTRKLGELNTRRVELDREIDEYEHWIRKAQGAEKELAEAEAAGAKARELEEELDARRKRLRTRLDEVAPSGVAEALLRFAMALDDLTGVPDPERRSALEAHQTRSVPTPSRAEAPLEQLAELFGALQASAQATEARIVEEGERAHDLGVHRATLEKELAHSRQRLEEAAGEAKRRAREIEDLRSRLEQVAKELAGLDDDLSRLRELEDQERELQDVVQRTEEDYAGFLQNQKEAGELTARREAVGELERENRRLEEDLETQARKVEEAARDLGEAREGEELEARRDALVERESELRTRIRRDIEDLETLEKDITKMQEARDAARELQRTIDAYYRAGKLLTGIRRVFQNAAPKLARRYLQTVSREATRGYRSLAPGDPAEIVWHEDYQVLLRGRFGEDEEVTEKDFSMLSGGEQMAVAISLKLALARVFSRSKVLFLDEPTIHLDVSRRENLAEHLARTSEELGFEQMVVISHDATFDAAHQHAVRLSKDDGTSRVSVG